MFIAVAAGVVACLGLTFSCIEHERHEALKLRCRANLEMIALWIEEHERLSGSLPPLELTNGNGTAVLSWRVLAAERIWYDRDFRTLMDFSEPWNGPKNSAFLKGFHPSFFRCPASRDMASPRTHYVAVVGPGAVWSQADKQSPIGLHDSATRDERHPALFVEWPESNIHWAEPRDITVDEFLTWFRTKTSVSNANHPGCVLYLDTAFEVHELPFNTEANAVRELFTADTSR
jgi:hypothetical protein